jgi:hypothetical protein
MMPDVDTVEWGSGGEASTKAPAWWRAVRVPGGGRRPAAVLAVLGFGALVAAEVVPWTSLHFQANTDTQGLTVSPTSDPVAMGIDKLNVTGTLTYHICLVLLLGAIGIVLAGRPSQQRTAFGAALGLVAAQIVIVVELVHSFAGLATDNVGGRFIQAYRTTVDPGVYLAFASIALLLAALVVAVLPARLRAQLVAGAAEPVEAEFTDAPLDLTVSAAAPLDEGYFHRPEPGTR